MEVVNYMQKVFKWLNFCSRITLWNEAFPKSATSRKYSVQAPHSVRYGHGGTRPSEVDSPATCSLASGIAPFSKEKFAPVLRLKRMRLKMEPAVQVSGICKRGPGPVGGRGAKGSLNPSPFRFLLPRVCFSPRDPPGSATSQQPPPDFPKLC